MEIPISLLTLSLVLQDLTMILSLSQGVKLGLKVINTVYKMNIKLGTDLNHPIYYATS